MQHYFLNDYFGWGWFLWCGVLILFFSSFGNWCYTYAAHRRYGLLPQKQAIDVINEQHTKGEITREQVGQMKLDISKASIGTDSP
ncbi:MAG: SHOCT domain-containing protein [Candidimonas sp.]|nr:MAG: SHOCT domain-containing protein [Candidimonas sp.]TAM24047.1 MAG: SHOCT domain-containing protein [Candidimonas sp.]